jgi:hypothetical protein
LLVDFALGMVNAHGKFGGHTIQIANRRSNQIPSSGMVNLLLLLLRFLSNNGLPIIMSLLVFSSQVYEIAGAHCSWHDECAW